MYGIPACMHVDQVLSEPGIPACMHVDPVFRFLLTPLFTLVRFKPIGLFSHRIQLEYNFSPCRPPRTPYMDVDYISYIHVWNPRMHACMLTKYSDYIIAASCIHASCIHAYTGEKWDRYGLPSLSLCVSFPYTVSACLYNNMLGAMHCRGGGGGHAPSPHTFGAA